MSNDLDINRQVADLFDKLIHNQAIERIDELGNDLPNDPAVLRYLAARCLEQSRKAARAGYHTEGRRLEILGRQLQQRISA